MSSLSTGPANKAPLETQLYGCNKIDWGVEDEDITIQTGVAQWRQRLNAKSMSLNVWKTNAGICGSQPAGPRLNLMQSREIINVQPVSKKIFSRFDLCGCRSVSFLWQLYGRKPRPKCIACSKRNSLQMTHHAAGSISNCGSLTGKSIQYS